MASSALIAPMARSIVSIHGADSYGSTSSSAGPSGPSNAAAVDMSAQLEDKSSRLLPCRFPGCKKTFKKACKLEDHQRTHTGERPFRCEHPGCEKDFRRKDHLQRHARSHVASSSAPAEGQGVEDEALLASVRPFQCTFHTGAAPDDAPNTICGRRFLSRQHLIRHIKGYHDQCTSCDETTAAESATQAGGNLAKQRRKRAPRSNAYTCSIPGCSAAFTKRKLLRSHINVYHSDKGRRLEDLDSDEANEIAKLPFACTFDGCTKRFPTNAKRNAHIYQRHSSLMRYVCTHDHSADGTAGGVAQFATWSELQAHQHAVHKPTCPLAHCAKGFKDARNLRLHLQRHHRVEGDDDNAVHEAQDGSLAFEESVIGGGFACDWLFDDGDGARCTQTFHTKYNRDVHFRTVHLGRKDFACPHKNCPRRFTSKRASIRHGYKCTFAVERNGEEGDVSDDRYTENDKSGGDEAASDDDDDFFRIEGGAVPEAAADRPRARKRAYETLLHDDVTSLGCLTGRSYPEQRAIKKRKMRGRVLGCPWSQICHLRENGKISKHAGESTSDNVCSFRFSRLYDVQRHLKRQHGLHLTQIDILALLDEEERSILGSPRQGTRIAAEAEEELKEDHVTDSDQEM